MDSLLELAFALPQSGRGGLSAMLQSDHRNVERDDIVSGDITSLYPSTMQPRTTVKDILKEMLGANQAAFDCVQAENKEWKKVAAVMHNKITDLEKENKILYKGLATCEQEMGELHMNGIVNLRTSEMEKAALKELINKNIDALIKKRDESDAKDAIIDSLKAELRDDMNGVLDVRRSSLKPHYNGYVVYVTTMEEKKIIKGLFFRRVYDIVGRGYTDGLKAALALAMELKNNVKEDWHDILVGRVTWDEIIGWGPVPELEDPDKYLYPIFYYLVKYYEEEESSDEEG